MKDVIVYIEEFNSVSIFLRLLLAVIFGGIVGAERGNNHQAAGIRTFALVCLGAALAMITNEYLSVKSGGNIDPSRMGAQVISGIGFLGVGTIIVTKNNQVRGLTTAASLWTVATLGIAIGSGFLHGAVMGFAMIMISVKVLQSLSRRQEDYNRILKLYMEVSAEDGMKQVLEYVEQKGYKIRSLQRKHQKAILKEDVCTSLEIDLKRKQDHRAIMEEIEQLRGVHYMEEFR